MLQLSWSTGTLFHSSALNPIQLWGHLAMSRKKEKQKNLKKLSHSEL